MTSHSLAARMKEYEHTHRQVLPRRTYTLLRLDGRAFHTYTRDLAKPFDHQFAADMQAATVALCQEATGVAFAYTQSDEISLLLTDFARITTAPWLGGVVAKLLSISTSIVTAAFASRRPGPALPTFDARLWTMSDPTEVANYFLWRQRDAIKNSVSMACHAHLSDRQVRGLNSDQRLQLLASHAGVDWSAYPVWAQRGSVVVRTSRSVVGPSGEAVERRPWQALGAPQFSGDSAGWLQHQVPLLPGMTVQGG